jgi:hypothetical protein
MLDPWNGCGTTTYVSRNLGFPSIVLDLNPFVSCVAAAKLICSENREEIHSILESAIQVVTRRRNRPIIKDDPLLEWFDPETAMEATVRPLSREEGLVLERLNPLSILTQATSNGMISRDDYNLLTKVMKCRHALAHGFKPIDFNPVLVTGLVGLTKHLVQSISVPEPF